MADNVKKNPKPDVWARRLAGMVLLPVVVFALLALVSHDSGDIHWLKVPQNSPSVNFFGVAGAYGVYFGYCLFGYAVWLLPLWMLGVALMMVFGRAGRLLWRNLGFMLLTLFAAMACALMSWDWLGSHDPNIPASGGVVTGPAKWIAKIFNPSGAWAFIACGLLASFAAAIGPHNFKSFALFLVSKRVKEGEQEDETDQTDRTDQTDLETEPAPERQNLIARLLRRFKKAPPDSPGENAEPAPPPESREDRELRRKENLKKRAEEIRRAAQSERQQPRPPRGNKPPRATPADEPAPAPQAEYILPTVDLLDPVPNTKADHGDVEATGALIVQTLQEFQLQTELTGVERGPVVTQYQVLPAQGIRVEKIASLANTLQLYLKATGLRVQTPVPGKGVVGIEVPNKVAQPVTLREVCSGEAWKLNRMEIPLCLGKDVSGRDLIFDLTQAPHLLVAGASGSGKSVGLNAILGGLLLTRKPDELRVMLVDPKRVEFSTYNDIPHLLVPVITDPKKVAFGLRWLIMEMDRRYKILQKAKVRNISTFNARPEAKQPTFNFQQSTINNQGNLKVESSQLNVESSGLPAKLPYIVIIIDEMADLMLTVGKEIEESITRLAALSRAVGIHMIIATQRPSVNVITGTIKANFPGRISFKVAQRNDSRTILDGQGAESLIGHGDMLFLNPKNSRLLRAQGAWISEDEVARLTEHCRSQAKPCFDTGLIHRMDKIQETKPEELLGIEDEDNGGRASSRAAADAEAPADESDDERTIRDAIGVLRDTRRASTSSLQRRLRLGYNRAARIMDMLEERGIVGPSRGADPREILIDLEGEIPAHISEVANNNNGDYADNDDYDDDDDDTDDVVAGDDVVAKNQKEP